MQNKCNHNIDILKILYFEHVFKVASTDQSVYLFYPGNEFELNRTFHQNTFHLNGENRLTDFLWGERELT